MNSSTAVFLVNEAVRALRGVYEPENPANPGYSLATGKAVKRELFKTFDPAVHVGDLVVVPVGLRHGYTIVKIVEEDVQVDMDSLEECRWVAGRFDQNQHLQTLQQEKEMLEVVHKAQLRKKQRDLAAAMFAGADDQIKALPIARAGDQAVADKPPGTD